MNEHYKIQFARPHDLKSIAAINKKWTITDLSLANPAAGFLFCECYCDADLLKLISNKEIVVCMFESEIIAYYINDNSSSLTEYFKAISQMKTLGKIGSESKVCLRTQIVVEKEYQCKGIPTKMLDFVKPFLKEKFDLLFSIGINENPKRIAHEKAGWRIIAETDEKYYCVFEL